DHVRHNIIFVVNYPVDPLDPSATYRRSLGRLQEMKAALQKTLPASRGVTVMGEVRTDLPGATFVHSVEEALEDIRAGEIIQVVLSRRYALGFEGDDFEVYRRMRSINPSPYMFYFNLGDTRVIGSSPEMLVRVEGGVATTCPIAGTRPRGDSPSRD